MKNNKITDAEQQLQQQQQQEQSTYTQYISVQFSQNSYQLHNSTQSPSLKWMTYLSSGWASYEKKNLNP